jgi:hypothetical protein
MANEWLLTFFDQAEFVENTKSQIVKDFSRLQIECDSVLVEKAKTHDEFVQLISNALLEVMELGESQLLQLLYLIDLPEEKFLSLLGKPELLQTLAYEILKREAQKVYLRTKYQ